MIGKKLSPILLEIESTIVEFDYYKGTKPEYTKDAMRAATKIFMSVLMDKMYELQDKEKIDFDDRLNMAEKAGKELKKLIKTFTNIDTLDFYKQLST